MISNDDLLALGDYLSLFITLNPHTLAIAGCDDTLRHTLAWLDVHTCDRSVWLRCMPATRIVTVRCCCGWRHSPGLCRPSVSSPSPFERDEAMLECITNQVRQSLHP
jgi:hypothetical protein